MVALKRQGWVNLIKGSLAGAIVPSSGTQPFTRLQKDGVLPCKVVIISTHALPRHPGRRGGGGGGGGGGGPMVKALTILSTQG